VAQEPAALQRVCERSGVAVVTGLRCEMAMAGGEYRGNAR
jgi:hypothetical protein